MFIIPQRVVMSIMGFWAVLLAYTIRTAISFAITKMVIPKTGGASSYECLVEEVKVNTSVLHANYENIITNKVM